MTFLTVTRETIGPEVDASAVDLLVSKNDNMMGIKETSHRKRSGESDQVRGYKGKQRLRRRRRLSQPEVAQQCGEKLPRIWFFNRCNDEMRYCNIILFQPVKTNGNIMGRCMLPCD